MSTESVQTAQPPRPGAAILEARIHADLTQEALSKLSAVSVNSIVRAEAGERLRPLTQYRLARALGKTRAEVFPEWQED